MSLESDHGQLLAAYAKLQTEVLDLAIHKKRATWWGALKVIGALAASFAGAGWTANSYLSQLATKDSQALLVKGLQEQLDRHDGRLALYNDRITVVEVLCDSRTRPLHVRP